MFWLSVDVKRLFVCALAQYRQIDDAIKAALSSFAGELVLEAVLEAVDVTDTAFVARKQILRNFPIEQMKFFNDNVAVTVADESDEENEIENNENETAAPGVNTEENNNDDESDEEIIPFVGAAARSQLCDLGYVAFFFCVQI